MGRAFIGNFKGPKGDAGPQGAQGIQGIQGPAGPTGAVDGNTPIGFTEAEALANIESGESISTIFGKTKKILGSLLIGAGSTLLGKNLTANQALVSDASGKVNVSGVTALEMGYLSGTTKNIQTQLNEQNEKLGGYYALSGGTRILEGEDLNADKYKVPGNYYCLFDGSIKTLKNLPNGVYTAFILKVDYSTGEGYPRQTFKTWTDGREVSRVWDNNVGGWGNTIKIATESYVDNKIQGLYFNFCPLSTLVTQTGVSNTDSTYNFFNSSNLKPGFYFGTASGGLLKGMATNTYNSYILFKAQTNFGKLFIMPTNGSTIYMLDAQKSDTWYTLHS